jgi:hypothetical protein
MPAKPFARRDLSEENDVAAEHPDVLEKMKAFAAEAHVPAEGLIAARELTVVRASSESRSNNRLAKYAVDGDPRTVWHTQFQGELKNHPHELVVDLGAEHAICNFRYLARQDTGWNGTIKECEFYVGNSPDGFKEPAAKVQFRKTKEPQEVSCSEVRGK